MQKIWLNKNYIAKQATKWTGVIFSIIGLAGTFVSLSDVLPTTFNMWVRLLISIGILVFIWIILFFGIGYSFNKKKWIDVLDAGNDCHVYVQYGDIFSKEEVKQEDERRNIVIPVNRCFDTTVDDDLISSRTLHGIAFKRLYDSGVFNEQTLSEELQRNLAQQRLISMELTRSDKRSGNLKRYDAGSIAEITISKECTYFFLGLSKFDYNLKAKTSAEDYALAMMKLVKYCNIRSQQFPVVIPLIGAGLARTDKSERDILEYMIKLLKLNRELIKSDIHIVVRDSGKETISITEL